MDAQDRANQILKTEFDEEFPNLLEWFSDLIIAKPVVDAWGDKWVVISRSDNDVVIAEYSVE